MTGIHRADAETAVWLTPPWIIDALPLADLDPCAAPEPRPWSTARKHITLPTNGLYEPWHGRVWLNPPYGLAAAKWLKRLAVHGDGIALVFARTDTAMFHTCVWSMASAVLFIKGRLTFVRPDGLRARANSGAPSCLVAYGETAAADLRDADIPGMYVHLEPSRERAAVATAAPAASAVAHQRRRAPPFPASD